QFAFARGSIIVALNNDDNEADINVEASSGSYTGLLSGKTFNSANGRLDLKLSGNYGEILVPGDVKVSDKDIMEAGAGAKVETAGVKVSDKEITEADAGVKEADAALKGSGKDITEADAGVKETDTAVKTADEVLKEVDAGVKAEFGKEEPVKEGKVAEDNVIEENFAEDPVAGEKAAEEKAQTAEVPMAGEKAAEVPMAGEKAAEVKVDADELLNIFIPNVPYEAMTVEQLQAVILNKMEGNGPLTDQMKKDVTDNIWHDSLVNWAKSFR
nr:hypothetical protein [Lachnospiraceae bacterium]